jgi:hypothetical protein
MPLDPPPTKSPLRCRIWPANCYYVSPQNRLLYCPIAKVACTSLKVWWVQNECASLAGEDPETLRPHRKPHRQFRYEHYADELGDEPLDDPRWFRFAFVRNPWARLVSAFVNKFVIWHGDTGGMLLNEFRRALPRRIAEQIVRNPDPANVLAPWWLLRSSAAWIEHFTFRQFVNHLATCNLVEADPHWRPQAEFLGPFDFHFIGRFEHLSRDFTELSRLLGRQVALPRFNSSTYDADDQAGECVADWPLCRLRKLPAAPHFRRFYTPLLAQTVGRLYTADVERFGYEFDRETAAGGLVEPSAAAGELPLTRAA